MVNRIYKCKGWIAAKTQYSKHDLKVKLQVDPSKKFLCHTCFKHGHIHSVRKVYITDLPCIDRVVELEVETPQIRCPGCGRFHTLRPDFVHPTMGFTWRFMRCISSLLMYVPARKLSEMYGLAPSTILRPDRGILKKEPPPPKLDGIGGILVDEKYLGPSYGFVTLVINARTGEPLHIAKGRDAGALESFFNRLTEEQKLPSAF